MLGTVSNAVGLLGYAALIPYAQPGSAVSAEADTVVQVASGIVQAAERSVVLFGDKAAALSSLRELASECSVGDWDAAGAHAIDLDALACAERFLRALPSSVPMPECSPEPDGSISLDWSESRHRLFSISISGSDRLAFAWLDGSDRGHGVARFDGRVVPERVLFGIRSILGQPHAPVRAA